MIISVGYTRYGSMEAVLVKCAHGPMQKDQTGIDLEAWLADLEKTPYERRIVLVYGDKSQAIRTVLVYALIRRFAVVARYDETSRGYIVISTRNDPFFKESYVIPTRELKDVG